MSLILGHYSGALAVQAGALFQFRPRLFLEIGVSYSFKSILPFTFVYYTDDSYLRLTNQCAI